MKLPNHHIGGVQNMRSVGMCAHCTHVFARLVSICVLSRCLGTELPHRRSGGSLLRVICWLGVLVKKKEMKFYCWSQWIPYKFDGKQISLKPWMQIVMLNMRDR